MDATARQIDYLAQELARMESQMIDPVDFGELRGEVNALKTQMASVNTKVDQLLEMANKGRGGLWMFNSGLMLAGAVGAWIVEHFLLKKP